MSNAMDGLAIVSVILIAMLVLIMGLVVGNAHGYYGGHESGYHEGYLQGADDGIAFANAYPNETKAGYEFWEYVGQSRFPDMEYPWDVGEE